MSGNTVIACYNLDGTIKRIFPSINSAARSMHVKRNNIYECIRGTRLSGKGYMWKEYNNASEVVQNIEPYKIDAKPGSIRIARYSLKGELLEIYPSIYTAAKEMGVHLTAIQQCRKGKMKTVNGCFVIKEGDMARLQFLMNNNHYFYKEVQQLSIDGAILKKYNSISEASKETGTPSKLISQAIRKHSKTNGYYWQGIK